MSDQPILGIDLGTTYTCVARLDETGRAAVLNNSDNEPTTPSVVFYDDGAVLVGKQAKKELEVSGDRVASLVKRHMGKPGELIHVAGKELHPQAVSGTILQFVVEDALAELGVDIPATGSIADAVITVPAYFGTAEREATRDAGTMARLEVIDIINEPTAAAIAHGLTGPEGERAILVYDLGGGTFDVTVMQVGKGEIRVVATGGDDKLGGADWDDRIVALLAQAYADQFPEQGDPRQDDDAGSPLVVMAEDTKKNFSRKDTVTTTVTAYGERAKIELSLDQVREATADLLERTLGFTAQVLEVAADKGVTRIDDVLLVGGMSRFRPVGAALRERFPQLPEPKLNEPDVIVAKGAALYAAVRAAQESPQSQPLFLAGGREVPTIVNVSSKGYGLRTVKDESDEVGQLSWLVKSQDPLPAEARGTFQTLSHGQRAVNIEVFESETHVLSEVVADNRRLVEGMLTGLPPNQPAGVPIEVVCQLGENGILVLHAESQGQKLRLEAKISGATPDEVLAEPLPAITR